VVGLGLDLSSADDPGGAELCSFAPDDVSLLVPAEEPDDLSSAAPDPSGAELCSFAPVEVSAPPAGGVCASSAAKAGPTAKRIVNAAIAKLRLMIVSSRVKPRQFRRGRPHNGELRVRFLDKGT
jgi:hypothetical protein